MDVDEIISEVLQLSNSDRQKVIKAINESILIEEIPNIEDDFKLLHDKLTSITGFEFMNRCRTRPLPMCRAMIAYKLRQRKYSLHKIGRCMGINHSSVLMYVHMIENMLDCPAAYSDEYLIWKQFNEKIYENSSVISKTSNTAD